MSTNVRSTMILVVVVLVVVYKGEHMSYKKSYKKSHDRIPVVCNLCSFILIDYKSLKDREVFCSIYGEVIEVIEGVKGVVNIPEWCPLGYYPTARKII